ncbi:MAG: hypothetical protein ABIT36_02190 [Steroidobacteraceae bacterium]
MGFFDAALLRTLLIAVFSAWLAVWFKDRWERRPKLIAFLWHAVGVGVPPQGDAEQGFVVNVHSVVLRNNGRKPSTNVRLGHAPVANLRYSVFPNGLHTENRLPDGGLEIRFDRLAPTMDVTITYLYFAPTLWQHVNT